MNRKQERELLVFTWLTDKGLRTVSELQAEMDLTEDEDFQMENTINDLVREGYLEQKAPMMAADQGDVTSWEITEKGRIHLKDLAQEKYEEKNKIPIYIWAVIFVIAVLTFMKLFPRMFHG
jgi:DNA-binding PadR family transcriptional regulator